MQQGRFLCPVKTVGIRARADIYAKNIEVDERGCNFLLCFHKRFRIPVQLRVPGIFNVYNSLVAAALCNAVGEMCIRDRMWGARVRWIAKEVDAGAKRILGQYGTYNGPERPRNHSGGIPGSAGPVSYTHLDVYKRQGWACAASCWWPGSIPSSFQTGTPARDGTDALRSGGEFEGIEENWQTGKERAPEKRAR